MTVLGPNVLQTLYQEYLDTEVTYNREVSSGLGLLPAEASLKWQGALYPCVVHSSSFRLAKVLVRLTAAQWKVLEFGSRLTTLTLVFLHPKTAKRELHQFNGTVQVLQSHLSPEGDHSLLLGITFSHRPSEGFLQAHGTLLALKREAEQRREDRISLDEDARQVLGLASLGTLVTVDHVPRKCLMREVSYRGARVILTGVPHFLENKPVTLAFPLEGGQTLDLAGTVVRAEDVEGHRGLAVLALGYDPDRVPMEYLRALQRGFRQGLGTRKTGPAVQPGQGSHKPQTSTIDVTTLKLVRHP